MFCPTCGNEIAVELKYCNRCGANLSLPTNTQVVSLAPVKLGLPSVVLGSTVIFGLLIIIVGATQMSITGMPSVAVVWLVLFAVAALFGCVGLMIRFWTSLIKLQRETITTTQQVRPQIPERPAVQQLPPRLDHVPSVTENTTRTFSPVYSEIADRGTKEY